MALRKQLVQKHWRELSETGYTVCESPLLRKMLYNRLREAKIKFSSEKVGDTGSGGKTLCPYVHRGLGYSPKRVMTWLRQGRIYKENMHNSFETYMNYNGITLEEIDSLFDATVDNNTKFEIVTRICDVPNKYGYFDGSPIHKLVKRIDADFTEARRIRVDALHH